MASRVQQNQSAQLLNLSHNSITDRGFKVLFQQLFQHEGLEEVEIRDNLLTDVVLRFLFQNLHKIKKLKKIDLSGNKIYESLENTQIRNNLMVKGLVLKIN